MNQKVFILACICILNAFADEGTTPVVTTPLGKVSGSYKTSADGRTFASFEGIPYAKPPIGKLRFAAPQPVEKWAGTWQANTLVACTQADGLSGGGIAGTEDCLNLNVYVPREKIDPSEKLDVIVSIHGGAYMSGSGHYSGPEYFMDRDVVFVTLNYRLNIFGFLSMQDEVLPGNNGLKDQSLALKWVQENIASFGGNPNSVTIIGISAGGSSVHYHYLSPLSKGLFHRGLSQSGTVLNAWALQDNPVQQAKKLAILAGCADTNSQVIVNCLRQRNAQFLAEQLKEFALVDGLPVAPISPFAPTVESGLKDAFLPDNPFYLLTQNKGLDVPWITSFTADEGVFFTSMVVPVLSKIDEKWDQLAAYVLDYNYTSAVSQWPIIAKSVKDEYFGNEDISLETADKYTNMLSQRMFKIAGETSAKLQAKANKSPVYFYLFNYTDTELSILHLIPNNPLKGVSHGDDMFYTSPPIPPLTNLKISSKDVELKNQFLDMITSYAKTDVPSFNGVTWEPTTSSELRYLKINGPNDMEMAVDQQLTDKDFWLGLGIKENENIVTSN